MKKRICLLWGSLLWLLCGWKHQQHSTVWRCSNLEMKNDKPIEPEKRFSSYSSAQVFTFGAIVVWLLSIWSLEAVIIFYYSFSTRPYELFTKTNLFYSKTKNPEIFLKNNYHFFNSR